MSRRVKLILFLVLAPVALVVLLVVAVLTPAVQTFAAKKALGEQGQVNHVAVGFSGAKLEGISITQPGLKIDVPSFGADVPVMDAAGGKIDVRSLVARNIRVVVDPAALATSAKASSSSPSVPAKAAQPFAGLLNAAVLPGDLTVNGLDVSGTITVTGAQPITADFALSGGGIGSGKQGKIQLKLTVHAPGTGDLTTTVDLVPTLDAVGQLSALVVQVAAEAQGGALTKPAALNADVAIARDGVGERYRVRLATQAQALVELDARWAPGGGPLPGRWKLALADSDLRPFLPPALVLPAFQLSGAGELALSGAERVQVAGQLQIIADALERLGAPALGAIALDTRFDVEASAGLLSVKGFQLQLAAAGEPVVKVETKQTFTVAPVNLKLTPSTATADLFEVRLLGIPPRWLKVYVPELALGGPITAAFKARPAGDGFEIETLEPLIVPLLRYGPEQQPVVVFDAIRVEGLRVVQNAEGVTASIGALRVIAEGVDVINGELSAVQKTGAAATAKAAVRVQLAALANQPVLRGQTRLSAGVAALTLDATAGSDLKVLANLRVTGLRAAGAGDLPEIQLDAEVGRDAAGVLTLKAPLSVHALTPAARTSDVTFALTVTPKPDGQQLMAQLSSQALFVPELQAFAALAAAAPVTPAKPPVAAPAQAPAGASATPAPTGPIWAGTTGELKLDLARIVYTPGIEVLKTQGRIALTKEALILEKIQTLLGTGGTLDLGAVLKWLADSRTYALEAQVGGRGLAVGPLLKALNPSAPAPLEGTYELAAKINGQGVDPAGAASAAAADIKLSGRSGVLRAFNLDANRYTKAGSTLASLAGLAGAFSGNAQLAERGAQVTALNAVARQFSNLPYDEFTLLARRGSSGVIELGELRLSAPEIKLAGSGTIQSLPGRTLVQQPLSLRFELGSRGEMARNLGVLRLLNPAAEGAAAEAFLPLVEPLVVDGTLQQIGTSQMMRLFSRVLGQ
ncbi:MAG: hypothetical protein NTU80_00095 [Verrucomicrobia bacterium]|nr:hypothetical protein [Verrucomicrobiota bacterium]